MKPPLSPAHGTSLSTTAGITAVISLVVGLSLLGQANRLAPLELGLASCSLLALLAGAGSLYAARNRVGHALDLAAADAHASGIAAAQALVRFHCGMGGVFAGCGFAAGFRLPVFDAPAVAVAPLLGLGLAAAALVEAAAWNRELARRRNARAPEPARV